MVNRGDNDGDGKGGMVNCDEDDDGGAGGDEQTTRVPRPLRIIWIPAGAQRGGVGGTVDER